MPHSLTESMFKGGIEQSKTHLLSQRSIRGDLVDSVDRGEGYLGRLSDEGWCEGLRLTEERCLTVVEGLGGGEPGREHGLTGSRTSCLAYLFLSSTQSNHQASTRSRLGQPMPEC
jgi:hypothetical protein